MHAINLDNLLWLASVASQILLLGIVVERRLFRSFPVFLSFVSWELISDLLFYLVISSADKGLARHAVSIYYSFGVVSYLFELAVLVEIARNVLRPATKALSRKVLYILLGCVLAIGITCFFVAAHVNAAPFFNLRVFLLMDTTAAILCVIVFLLIAGFSQVLGLSWRNHVLQLTTGLAFYSVVDLTVELMQSQLHAGPHYAAQYQMWSQVEVIGYLCTLSFWCYAFLKKEAPRKEFSPQMAQVLVLLSGGAKRQHAVLARSRDD